MVEVSGLNKSFKKKKVLSDLEFKLGRGEALGIAGPNGSGKTTLLNILMGMVGANSGILRFDNGLKIGMAVSRKGFFNDMSVVRNLQIQARLKNSGASCVDELMEEFGIDFGDTRFGELSAGMKQRVSLVVPFLDYRDLIFLDEPSNHLDIDSILILRKKINDLKKVGISFLITSHIFNDLEKTCDRILFLKEGKLILDKNLAQLLDQYGSLEEAYLRNK